MIVYDKLWETMKRKGITKYRLRDTYFINQRTISKLMKNENVETMTLDKLCNILDCSLEEIATHIKVKDATPPRKGK